MNTEKQRSILIPSTEFDNLKNLIERLTSDTVQLQNGFGSRNQRLLEIYSTEGKANLNLRSELYVNHEGKIYQSLTIAIIAFIPERSGIGSNVLEWLKSYAVFRGFERICIENAHTDASKGFARKHGFSNVPKPPILSQLLNYKSYDFHLILI